MRTSRPHVKKYKWGRGAGQWVVDGLKNEQGKRIRKFFKSRDLANEWLASRRPELNNHGWASLTLSDTQRSDAVRALALLAPHGITLREAAEAYVERATLLDRTITFAALRSEIFTAKKADRMSKRYLSDIQSRLMRFAEQFDARPVAAIETREIDDWLRGLDLSPTSRKNFRKVLRTSFEYAVGRGYAKTNPVVKTAKVKVQMDAPGVLAPHEVAAILEHADPQIVPWIAIAAFAGLRDAEISRLTWDRVDLAGGHIKVDAAIAKTSSRRLVPIAPNLATWLAPYSSATGPIRPSDRISYPLCRDARGIAAKALKDAGASAPNLEAWPHNAFRHSFASYRMALVANAAQVAEECGNSVQIMKQHYRELVTKAEAEKWFAVVPATGAGVIPFSKAAS